MSRNEMDDYFEVSAAIPGKINQTQDIIRGYCDSFLKITNHHKKCLVDLLDFFVDPGITLKVKIQYYSLLREAHSRTKNPDSKNFFHQLQQEFITSSDPLFADELLTNTNDEQPRETMQVSPN